MSLNVSLVLPFICVFVCLFICHSACKPACRALQPNNQSSDDWFSNPFHCQFLHLPNRKGHISLKLFCSLNKWMRNLLGRKASRKFICYWFTVLFLCASASASECVCVFIFRFLAVATKYWPKYAQKFVHKSSWNRLGNREYWYVYWIECLLIMIYAHFIAMMMIHIHWVFLFLFSLFSLLFFFCSTTNKLWIPKW